MKLLYCVVHTELHKDREKNILSTWGKDKDVIFYGDYELSNNPMLLKVSSRSDYASGEEKQINVISKLAKTHNDYDWYYFCDNDTFVNTKLLEQFYLNCNENKVYGELANTWPEDESLFYFMGGAGFLMSKKILTFLSDKIFHNPVPWGDVSIGINFRHFEIERSDEKELFHSQPPEFYSIPYQEVKNHISFHYIKTFEDMQTLWNYCQ